MRSASSIYRRSKAKATILARSHPSPTTACRDWKLLFHPHRALPLPCPALHFLPAASRERGQRRKLMGPVLDVAREGPRCSAKDIALIRVNYFPLLANGHFNCPWPNYGCPRITHAPCGLIYVAPPTFFLWCSSTPLSNSSSDVRRAIASAIGPNGSVEMI